MLVMATGSIDAANQLVVALDAIGLPCSISDEQVLLTSLGVKVVITDVDIQPGGAVVVYDLRQLESSEAGIRILAVGLGSDPTKALGEAAFQWVMGVLQPVQHWLKPTAHSCFVDDFHLLVEARDTEERFPWRVHVGPIISRAFGPDADEAPLPAVPKDIFRILLSEVQVRAAHRTLFWIEAYVVRFEDGRVDATCRFRNEDWSEGKIALAEWATTWNTTCAATVSVRQFLLFESISMSELPDRDHMIDTLLGESERTRVPWWRRLLKRRHNS